MVSTPSLTASSAVLRASASRPSRSEREGEVRQRKRMPRTATQRFLRLGDRSIVSAGAVVDHCERVGRSEIARICRLPQLERLGGQSLIAGHPVGH